MDDQSSAASSDAHSLSNPTGTSSKSVVLHPIRKKHIPKQIKTFEIDYVGGGTFQVSQLNLLGARSMEPFKDSDAILSSRGLHHRSREVFVKDVQNATSLISNLMRKEKVTSVKYKPSVQLFPPHFSRALAFERLNQIDKAIEDYTMCLRIDPNCAAAYYNRSGLYKAKGNMEAAIVDINKAVQLEPANLQFRNNRSILYRNSNYFMEAVQDTLLCKALSATPGLAKLVAHGESLRVDPDEIMFAKILEDPIIVALNTPSHKRVGKHLESIVDFLKTCKFFAEFSAQDVFYQVAREVQLEIYKPDKVIFEEREIGRKFYLILDGEVSIVKVKHMEDYDETTVLVKLYRGQSFGETALESKDGHRTAGAVATQLTRLLMLNCDDYHVILAKHKVKLKEEVLLALSTSAIFADWEKNKLEQLAGYVVVRSYGGNNEILLAGDKVTSVMMIKSGIVKLIKKMPKPNVSKIHCTTKDGQIVHEELDEPPGLWVLDKNWRNRIEDEQSNTTHEQVEFTVGILGSGQVFGELAVLDPEQPSPVTAISCTAVELYCFESDVLIGLGVRFNTTTMNALNESINLHDPPAEKISYYFRSKYNWEIRKTMLIDRLSKSQA